MRIGRCPWAAAETPMTQHSEVLTVDRPLPESMMHRTASLSTGLRSFSPDRSAGRCSPVEQRIRGDLLPEGAQLCYPLGRSISGNDRGVDRANGNPGDPVEVGFGERFVDAGLIGAERAAPLQQ